MSGKILLVEDNEDDLALTLRALKKKQINNEVVIARDGVEALDMLFGRSGQPIVPVLILLDLKLPRQNGLEVLKEIKQNDKTKSLSVVVLTTSNQEEDISKSYFLGANSYIRKPVDFLQFTETVGQLGMYWLSLNEPNPQINA